MRYYKVIENGYIPMIGIGDGGMEISEPEYKDILSIIQNKPPETETFKYRLTEDLIWESYIVEPPEPSEDVDEFEALNILLGGAE